MSGMGELHLDVYVERMKREYKCEVEVGKPQVNFLETIQSKADFSYLHKKQSGGSGQYGKVEGWLEPMDPNAEENLEFENQTVGGSIPPNFIAACQKGFDDVTQKGPMIGQPVTGVKMVVNDGASHAVDSSELAFRIATQQAFKQGFMNAGPQILEPIMTVEVTLFCALSCCPHTAVPPFVLCLCVAQTAVCASRYQRRMSSKAL